MVNRGNKVNWWFDTNGTRNTLKGVENDPANPIILTDDQIITFMLEDPQARIDFLTVLPTMLSTEQDRLNAIVAANPRIVMENPLPDEQTYDDYFMKRINGPVCSFDPNRRGGIVR